MSEGFDLPNHRIHAAFMKGTPSMAAEAPPSTTMRVTFAWASYVIHSALPFGSVPLRADRKRSMRTVSSYPFRRNPSQ